MREGRKHQQFDGVCPDAWPIAEVPIRDPSSCNGVNHRQIDAPSCFNMR